MKGAMTVRINHTRKLAAAALALALAPMGAWAAETAPMIPHAQQAQETGERLTPFGEPSPCWGVTVSRSWLRQGRLNGVLINLRLHTAMGEEVTFREQVKVIQGGDGLCLNLQASSDADVIIMQLDQPAMDTLKRLGITQVVVADADLYVRARYDVAEMDAVRAALGLADAELLCLSGEDAPVTVISEDGVRRQVNP